MSERHACRLLNLARSTHRYKPHDRQRNDRLRQRRRELAEKPPRFRLSTPARTAKPRRLACQSQAGSSALPRRAPQSATPTAQALDTNWPASFGSSDACQRTLVDGFRGRLYSERTAVRVLNIVDDHTRESLAVEVDSSLGAGRVLRALEQAVEQRGKPTAIVCDNGPEFRARALQAWGEQRNITLAFIEPGKPDAERLRFTLHLFQTLRYDRSCWATK